jgi:hypothetical protein
MSASQFTYAAISGALTTSIAATAASSEIYRMTGFLCVGTCLGVAWACLSKQAKEEGRINKARMIAGVVFGVPFPRLVEFLYNWGSPWGSKINMEAMDPLLLIFIGFLCSTIGFFIGHTVLRNSERDQGKIGDMVSTAVVKQVESSLNKSTKAANEDDRKNSEQTPGN